MIRAAFGLLACCLALASVVPRAGAQSAQDLQQMQRLMDVYLRHDAGGEYDQALSAAEQCYEFARSRQLGMGLELSSLEYVARARKNRGDLRESIELYNTIASRAEPWNPPNDLLHRSRILLLGNSWRFSAGCYERLGDYPTAIAFTEKARDFFRQNGYHAEAAQCQVDLGWTLHETAQPDKALEQFRQGLAVLEPAARRENPPAQYSDTCGACHLGIGTVYTEQGRYDLAEQHFRRSIGIYAAVRGWNHPWTASAMAGLARIYARQNRHDDAEQLLVTSIGAYKASTTLENPDALNALNTLARVYANQGRNADAEEIMRFVVRTRQDRYPDLAADLIAPLVNLASLLHVEQKDAQAEPLVQQALTLSEKIYGSVHPMLVEPLGILGQVRLALGQSEDALKLYDRAFEIHRQTPMPIGSAAAMSELRAECLWKLGRQQEALAETRRSIEAVELHRAYSSGAERERAVTFTGFETLYDMLLSWRVEQRDVAEMFAIIESRKARSFLDELRINNADLLQGLPETQRGQLLTRERELRQRLTEAEQRFSALPNPDPHPAQQLVNQRQAIAEEVLAARDALYRHLSDMRTASPVYRQLLTAQAEPITLPATQRQVGSDELLLSYKIGRQRSFVIIVRREHATFVELKVDDRLAAMLGVPAGPLHADQLASLLLGDSGVLAVLANPSAGQDVTQKLLALWETLIPEAERKALTGGSIKLLTVLPDGPLALLPFEALVVAGTEPVSYLLDAGPPIHYAPSAAVLNNLAGRTVRSLTAREPLLTLGDPAYRQVKPADDAVARLGVRSVEERFRAGLARLPFSGWEASWVEEQFKNHGLAGVKLTGSAGTEAQLRALCPGRQIVHLACHGMADESYGNFFGCLAIAPGNAGDSNDDGFLYASEICQLDLHGCELAILSACQTNYGPQQRGEGVWNLSRAFLVAGARRVVASNWVVDDEAGATLVNNFAGYLAQAGSDSSQRDYAAALQKAKQKIRQQDRWSNPFYWSSLVLVGPK